MQQTVHILSRRKVASTIALILCFGVITASGALDQARIVFVAAMLVGSALCFAAWKTDQWSTREIIVFAVLFRVILLPLLPSLSDDGYRYVWDGMLQWEGINPFVAAPTVLDELHDLPLYDRLNSPGYHSVYPPISQIIFLIGGWVPPGSWPYGFLLIKLVVSAVEVTGLLLLARMVRTRALILYAWNPLVVVETAGQGHTEGLMAGLIVLTIFAVRESRPQQALGALTAAVWTKLYPVLLIPFVLVKFGWRHVWLPVLFSATIVAPYLAPTVAANVFDSLQLYVGLFEFYAAPYFLLKWAGYELLDLTNFEGWLGRFLTVGILAAGVLGYVRVRAGRWSIARASFVVVAAYLFFATTVHPWYFLGLLALAPLQRRTPWHWLWLAAWAPGTYLLYTHDLYWPFVWIGWAGWVVLALFTSTRVRSLANRRVDAALRYLAARKAERLRPFLHPPGPTVSRLLDLGAGEGYVGAELSRDPGREVILCDVRDANQTNLPYLTYDGDRLPVHDNAFDDTILVLTLHHTEDARAVLAEALRVSSRSVVLIESTFDTDLEHRLLHRLDRFANRLRSGGSLRSQEHHLKFRQVQDWITLTESLGGEIDHVRRWGVIHKQVLIAIRPGRGQLPGGNGLAEESIPAETAV